MNTVITTTTFSSIIINIINEAFRIPFVSVLSLTLLALLYFGGSAYAAAPPPPPPPPPCAKCILDESQ